MSLAQSAWQAHPTFIHANAAQTSQCRTSWLNICYSFTLREEQELISGPCPQEILDVAESIWLMDT